MKMSCATLVGLQILRCGAAELEHGLDAGTTSLDGGFAKMAGVSDFPGAQVNDEYLSASSSSSHRAGGLDGFELFPAGI
jgi:hypothetical protein